MNHVEYRTQGIELDRMGKAISREVRLKTWNNWSLGKHNGEKCKMSATKLGRNTGQKA